MGSIVYKKDQALKHNELRAYRKKCAEELAQDMVDNPEKYVPTGKQRRVRRKAMAFV